MSTVINGWTVNEYINDIPIEEYTQEEIDNFFENALDKVMLFIGYAPVKNTTKQPVKREGQ